MVWAMAGRRFAYCREPLCLLAAGLYACNHFWWKPGTPGGDAFVHCYLGDTLCLPVLLPLTLWLQRRLGLRSHDGAPTWPEWLGHWALWSICFEVLGPSLPLLAPGAVPDPWDVLAYAAGGAVGAVAWSGAARPRAEERGRRVARTARAGVAVAVAAAVLCVYQVRILPPVL